MMFHVPFEIKLNNLFFFISALNPLRREEIMKNAIEWSIWLFGVKAVGSWQQI